MTSDHHLVMGSTPDGFDYLASGDREVRVTRGGRVVTVLRGGAAARFLAEVATGDPQHVMDGSSHRKLQARQRARSQATPPQPETLISSARFRGVLGRPGAPASSPTEAPFAALPLLLSARAERKLQLARPNW